jgi:membrane associated rhomboid family serine protease
LERLANSPSTHHRRAYKLLHWVFENGGSHYNFKSLYEFKLKLQPSRIDPVYLIYSPQPFGLRVIRGLLDAFVAEGIPRAVIHSILSGAQHGLRVSTLDATVRKLMDPSFVALDPATSMRSLLKRTAGSFTLASGLVALFLLTIGPDWKIMEPISRFSAFSWQQILEPQRWILPGLLHWDPFHIIVNLVFFSLFCAPLEYLLGTQIFLWVFAVCALVSNPITSALLMGVAQYLAPAHLASWAAERDLGASLGIFGCAGGLTAILKHGAAVRIALTIGILVFVGLTPDALQLNHWIALLLGWGLVRWRMR